MTAQSVEPAAPYDYIVCGAGTAGCLLANRLSADRTKRVLLIEAGGNDDYLWVHIPVGYLYCIGNPRTDWLYATEPAAGLNGRSLRYPRGKVLGGCSSINGMIYMRGQARDYDGWGAGDGFGANPGWSWDALPSLLPQARGLPPGRRRRSTLRPGSIRPASVPAANGGSRSSACAGTCSTPSPRRPGRRASRTPTTSTAATTRASATSRSTSAPASAGTRPRRSCGRSSAGPTCRSGPVRTSTGSSSTPRAGPSACGSPRPAAAPPQTARLAAGGEVVLATGAIGTPQILQLSGIGPAPLLQARGIAVRRDLAGVGENLQDHLQIRAVFGVEGVQTLNGLANSLWGKAKIGLQYAWKRSGPMSMAPSQLGAFTRSRPDLPHPNLEYHVQPLSLDAFGEPLHRYDAFTASVCNLNPTSRGKVQIRTASGSDAPRIAPDYLATEEDRLVAAESLRVTRRIVAQPALARFKPRELKPGVQFESDAELAQLAGDIGTTIFHPVGTAKMGPAADPNAVVDARLRVHGVPGLRVVDASVMPTITSGNTNSPTLMIAERAAEWIRSGE